MWLLLNDDVDQCAVEDAVRTLLEFVGENPDREGLKDTPKRVRKALTEMTEGYKESPGEILSTTFDGDGYDQMVVVDNIKFYSMCEHHMLPFVGTAHVGYIPKSRVVGLSKIPRLVHCFSKRLQIQERLTTQIAETLNNTLEAQGVGVYIEAHHMCVSCRGVKQQGSSMKTSCLLGVFKDQEVRSEFFSLVNSPRLH